MYVAKIYTNFNQTPKDKYSHMYFEVSTHSKGSWHAHICINDIKSILIEFANGITNNASLQI